MVSAMTWFCQFYDGGFITRRTAFSGGGHYVSVVY